MVVTLAGRAAEQVDLRPGHDRRRERPREGHRARPLDGVRVRHGRDAARRARCAPTTTRSPRTPSGSATSSRRTSPSAPTPRRFACSTKHRALLDRVALALLEKETLSRKELLELFGDVEPESRASEAVGVVRALGADAAG